MNETITPTESIGGSINETDGLVVWSTSDGWYQALRFWNLALSSIAAVLCLIIIVAMTAPLLSRKRRKIYTTYNLYLVYLAIPDLIANVFVVYLVLAQEKQRQNNDNDNIWMFDHPFDHNIYALCVASNLYTNAFLSVEIFKLLKDSNLMKRHKPPTIQKVTCQAFCAYGVGIFMFLLEYYINDLNLLLDDNGDTNDVQFILYQIFSFLVVVVIPVSILFVQCYKIKKQRLLQTTKSLYHGRLRVLVVYFARIVIVYLSLWMPASIAYMVQWSLPTGVTKVVFYGIFLVLVALQPMVSFGFCLTKPDACKFIVLLLNCDYCVNCNEDVEASYPTEADDSYPSDPYLGRLSIPVETRISAFNSGPAQIETEAAAQ